MLPFEIAVVGLAAALFLPVSKLVWVLSVRRLERRLGHALSEKDRRAQLNRARFIAVFLCLLFSWLFNTHLTSVTGPAVGG